MWNSLLDNARTLAAQAKAAAEKLEDTINVSVGAPPMNNTVSNTTASTVTSSSLSSRHFEMDANVDLWEDSNTALFDLDVDDKVVPQDLSGTGSPSLAYEKSLGVEEQEHHSTPPAPPLNLPLSEILSPGQVKDEIVHNIPLTHSNQCSDTSSDQNDDVVQEGDAWDFSTQEDVDLLDDETKVNHQIVIPQSQQPDDLAVTSPVESNSSFDNSNPPPSISLKVMQSQEIDIESTTELDPIAIVSPSTLSTTTPSMMEEPESTASLNASTCIDPSESSLLIQQLQSQIQQLQQHVVARELQLTSKSEQITTMLEIHQKEKETLVNQVRETKEEAKKRILVAKERVGEMQQHVVRLETELTAKTSTIHESSIQKDELIQALREEGEALAKKMSEVEQRAKETRIQLLDVQDELTTQLSLKEKMEKKLHDLDMELKSTRTKYTHAQQSEVRAEQLEKTLLELREESEIKSAKILSLETEVKENKILMNSMKREMDDLVRLKETENQSDVAKWKKEKSEWMEEFNTKVRILEQEATVREDALRKEVNELRKRWQDAVHRADALSMDMQQSSAPLMRQIESAERQNRARAVAWTELETRLRSENEELNTTKDQLIKERNELGSIVKRLERSVKDKEEEISKSQKDLEQLNMAKIELESKLVPVQKQLTSIHKDHAEAMKSLKDHEAKIRNDMTRLIRESEVKYQQELDMERQTRIKLERKIEELLSLSNSDAISQTSAIPAQNFRGQSQKSSRKKLITKDDQVSILQSAIIGLSVEDDENLEWVDESEEMNTTISHAAINSSFAHTEQLLQGLKVAKLELETLRSQFNDAEATKEALLVELARCKDAGERLPSLEKNYKIIESELKEKILEVSGLREDIAEVRLLYRAQLDALLEEKTRSTGPTHEPRNKLSQDTEIDSDDVVIHYIN